MFRSQSSFDLGQRMKHWLAYYTKRTTDFYPPAYLGYLRFKYHNKAFLRRIVRPDTDLCIEGYNRSANSFAVKAFRDANDSETYTHKLATHTHASSQVKQALAYGIPTMVLIREPLAAVASQKALAVQLMQVKDPMAFPIEIFVRLYMDFYRHLQPYADQFVVVSFEQATSDFSRVIERLNTKFGTSYAAIEHTKDKEEELFEKGRVHLSPSPERDAIKRQLEQELDTLKQTSLLAEAGEVYRRFSIHAEELHNCC